MKTSKNAVSRIAYTPVLSDEQIVARLGATTTLGEFGAFAGVSSTPVSRLVRIGKVQAANEVTSGLRTYRRYHTLDLVRAAEKQWKPRKPTPTTTKTIPAYTKEYIAKEVDVDATLKSVVDVTNGLKDTINRLVEANNDILVVMTRLMANGKADPQQGALFATMEELTEMVGADD